MWRTLDTAENQSELAKTSNAKRESGYPQVRMVCQMRFPVADIADLYAHRWEIELGYREMNQYMLNNELTLISKKPEIVRQELWGALLAYNLIPFQIGKMAYRLDSILPIQFPMVTGKIFSID